MCRIGRFSWTIHIGNQWSDIALGHAPGSCIPEMPRNDGVV